MKKILFLAWVLVAVFGGMLFSDPLVRADGGKMQFSQSILPVQFVYFDKNGNIAGTWNNVSQADDAYVLKFFDEKKQEISLNNELIAQYIKKGEEVVVDSRITKCTQVIEKNNSIEEIKTIV